MIDLPLVEEFSSIQGEGVFTGVPMRFIRLGGCNVGVYEDRATTFSIKNELDTPLKIYSDSMKLSRHSVCTTVFGERFLCDTNYRTQYRKSLDQLFLGMHAPKEEHICLTGGEPFLHPIGDVYGWTHRLGKMLHIETSGTKDIWKGLGRDLTPGSAWITCSPKLGFDRRNINIIDEWKFVVGPGFDPKMIHDFFDYAGGKAAWDHPVRPVYLQPINAVDLPDPEAVAAVYAIIEKNPGWRLSVQLHKYLRLR